MNADLDRHEVIVIGGGQAGLALGYHLAHQDGDSRSSTPATPRQPPALALGLADAVHPRALRRSPRPAFPGDPDHYPTRDEVVEYLTDYARDFELPVELNARVRAVRAGERDYLVETDDRAYKADQVVIATGPFQTPRIPSIAPDLAAEIHQLHSSDYRRPDDIPDGPVLVVGGGNTGFQIAHELAATREVHLAIGSRQAPLPQQLSRTRPLHDPDRDRADGQDRRLQARPPAQRP